MPHLTRGQPGESDQIMRPERVFKTAFQDLSESEQDVVVHYVEGGGKRGWTDSTKANDNANNLRVRLHRALKKLRSLVEQQLNEQRVDAEESLLSAITSMETMKQALSVPSMDKRPDSHQATRYICIVIQVPEEEFNVTAREALFDHFPFEQISISRSTSSSCDLREPLYWRTR